MTRDAALPDTSRIKVYSVSVRIWKQLNTSATDRPRCRRSQGLLAQLAQSLCGSCWLHGSCPVRRSLCGRFYEMSEFPEKGRACSKDTQRDGQQRRNVSQVRCLASCSRDYSCACAFHSRNRPLKGSSARVEHRLLHS